MSLKEDRFCIEYVKCGVGAKAAVIAGYSQKTARTIASKLLTKVDVQQRIKYLKENVAETIGVNPAMVANELRKIAFSSVSDTRTSWMTLKDFKKLSEDARAAIAEVQYVTETVGRKKVSMVKVKLHSKLSAIDSLNKMLGYNAPEKTEVSIPKVLSDDVLLNLASRINNAAK